MANMNVQITRQAAETAIAAIAKPFPLREGVDLCCLIPIIPRIKPAIAKPMEIITVWNKTNEPMDKQNPTTDSYHNTKRGHLQTQCDVQHF